MQHTIDMCNIKAFDRNGKEYIKYPKLIELHEYLFNQTPKNLHNSFNDIIVCLRCFYKLEQKTDILEIDEELKMLYIKLLN